MPRKTLLTVVYLIGFASGVFVTWVTNVILHPPSLPSSRQGHSVQENALPTLAATSPAQSTSSTSQIYNLRDVGTVSTSHAGTLKRPFVRPFQVHPNLAGISVARLDPGREVERHVHPTMHEFMYVLEGSMTVNYRGGRSSRSSSSVCGPGCLFHGAPAEPHSFRADPATGVQFFMVQLTTTASGAG